MTSDAENWGASDEYERAFWAYAKASEATAEAVRLEKAAKETTGAERRENLEQAADERAKAASAIASLDDNPQPEPENDAAPLARQTFQEREILRALGEVGHEPAALPRWSPGKPGVKAAVRKKLDMTDAVFKKAWERLRRDGEIADA